MPFRANFVISFGRSIGQTLFQNFVKIVVFGGSLEAFQQ